MKPTKKQFNLFKDLCLELQKKWGLLDWDILVVFEKLKDGPYAKASLNSVSKKATISMNSENIWHEFDDAFILNNAKHEMIHVLLGDYTELCRKRFNITENEEESILEATVIRLCKLI